MPQAPRLQEPWEQPSAALHPELWARRHSARGSLPAQGLWSAQQFRRARPEAARRVVPVVRWSARLSGHPRSEVALARRAAAVAPSCFRRAEEERPSAALLEPAWWQAPAAAWRQPGEAAAARAMVSPSEMRAAAVAEQSVRQVASAPQARLPAEEAAAASGAKVQPQGAAEAESAPSVQQPGEAAAVSGVGVVLPPEAVGAALDAVAEPQQAVAAEVPLDAEVLRPGVVEVEQPAPSVRQPAAGHPSAPPSWRLGGHPLPWLAPRRAVRSAHAMRRSRAASPSRQS